MKIIEKCTKFDKGINESELIDQFMYKHVYTQLLGDTWTERRTTYKLMFSYHLRLRAARWPNPHSTHREVVLLRTCHRAPHQIPALGTTVRRHLDSCSCRIGRHSCHRGNPSTRSLG